MKQSVTRSAYAKINLFLEVADKRHDGYHDIDSVMQSVTLSDTVTVSVSDGEGIFLTCDSKDIPTDGANIAYRAIEAYNSRYGISCRTECSIEKRIPVSAGLAGGSTDAAAVLLALDSIHKQATSTDELCEIGKTLGADVPFCIRGGIARTRGIGEDISFCPKLPRCAIVIAIGDERVSTKEAYEKIDALPDRIPNSADSVIDAISAGDIDLVCSRMFNVFERVSGHSSDIKRIMTENGAVGTMMSGSGPSVFGIFYRTEDAERACAQLTEKGYRAFSSHPTDSENS